MKFRHKQTIVDAYLAEELTDISTLEVTLVAQPGDWIVRGLHSEVYPVKPALFHQLYEECAD